MIGVLAIAAFFLTGCSGAAALERHANYQTPNKPLSPKKDKPPRDRAGSVDPKPPAMNPVSPHQEKATWRKPRYIEMERILPGDKYFNDIQERFHKKLSEDERLRSQYTTATSDQSLPGLDVYRDKNFPNFWSVPSQQMDVFGFKNRFELTIVIRRNSYPSASIRERIENVRFNPETWWHGSSSLSMGALVYTHVPDKDGKMDSFKDVVISIVEKGKIEMFKILYGPFSNPA